MLTNEQIELFFNDLQSLGLRFPVAELSRRTGMSKGNISMYLSRKLEPSENFIDKFYKEFAIELKKNDIILTTVTTKPNFGETKPEPPKDDLIQTVKDQAETIKNLSETILKLVAKG